MPCGCGASGGAFADGGALRGIGTDVWVPIEQARRLSLGVADLEHPEWGSAAGPHVFGFNERLQARIWARPAGADAVAAYGEDLGRRCTEALWNLFAARMDWARAGTG